MTDPTDVPPPAEAGRAIHLAIEVPGTPEEVWQAVATGPGIGTWFVPGTVEEREGGATRQRFGPMDGMEVSGRVAAWEPPRRVVFTGDEAAGPGMVFEWLVEARDGGTCVVRLVNSGFGDGEDWDGQYDSMHEGWKMFLHNLLLHRTHFAGRPVAVAQPMAVVAGTRDAIWSELAGALGLPADPLPGQAVRTTVGDAPTIAGTVARVRPAMLTLLIDEPGPGTALVAVEEMGGAAAVSIWCWLCDDAGRRASEVEAAWQAWLVGRFPAPPPGD